MKYKIVKVENLSGMEATIYSVIIEGESNTLFDRFVKENIQTFKDEVKDIYQRLKIIGSKTGAREEFFKLKEGSPGDLVAALYDDPDSKLRLYCIRYGSVAIILGGGGHKPKTIRSLQQDPKLTLERNLIKDVSDDIFQKMKDGDICWSHDGKELLGTLNFIDDEEQE